MLINNAWINGDYIVIELPNMDLKSFAIEPFRKICEEDLTMHQDMHPKRLKLSALQQHFYKFYGLEKNPLSATEIIAVKLTPVDVVKYEKYIAKHEKHKGMSKSDFTRILIKELIKDESED